MIEPPETDDAGNNDEADEAEARAAIREQHPDLFRAPAPAAPNKPRVFTDTSSRSAPAGAAPTYISRPVSNAGDLHAWAEAAGLSDLVAPQDMHVTIVYSREPFDAGQLPAAEASMLVSGGKRTIDVLGDEKAVVLRFDSPQLQQRWQQTRDAGASWDYEGFKPHVTLSYTAQEVPAGIEPYRGPLVLGPEKVEALDTGEAPLQSRAQRSAEIVPERSGSRSSAPTFSTQSSATRSRTTSRR